MSRVKSVAFNVALVVAAALTVLACGALGASYYVPATLLVVYGIVGAFAGFERSGDSVRMMALIAVACALSIISRVAFAPVPFFKPTAGVVMLFGIALGARSGFLVGAIAMFASNLMFGQGPWTPWQMLAFGLDGMVFGLLADKGVIAQGDWSMRMRVAVSTGAAVFVVLVSGPILDTSSVLIFSTGAFTVEGTLAVYLAGLVPNAVLAIATFLTLFVLGSPFLAMIGRVRSKYGIGIENTP